MVLLKDHYFPPNKRILTWLKGAFSVLLDRLSSLKPSKGRSTRLLSQEPGREQVPAYGGA